MISESVVSEEAREKAYRVAEVSGFKISAGDSFQETWQKIPVSDVEDHAADLSSKAAGSSQILFSSGGSTGSPKFTLLSFSEMLENCYQHGEGYKECGITENDTVATWGLPGAMNSEFTVYLALSKTGCRILPVGQSESPANLLEVLKRFKPTVLLVMPSDLTPLIHYLENGNETFSGIRLVVTGGEPLCAPDKKRFQKIFGNQVLFRSVFQTSDTGTIGFQCEHSKDNQYHIHEELQLIEIVNPNFDGGGELVTTNLSRLLKPVVRVRTGDLARRVPGVCACGRSSKRIELLGRTGKFVKIGGEKFDLNWLAALRIELNLPLDDFQVRLNRSEHGCDRLVFLSNILSEIPEMQARTCRAIKKMSEKISLQMERGIVAQPEFLPLPKDEVLVGSTGKFQFFLDVRGRTDEH